MPGARRRGARPGLSPIRAGTEAGEPADRPAWLPRGFLFLGRAYDYRESRSMHAPCAPLLTVPLRPRYATTGATAILARRPGTSTEFVPVVHGTGTLMQGPFETRNTNLGSIMGFREKSNNLYRN